MKRDIWEDPITCAGAIPTSEDEVNIRRHFTEHVEIIGRWHFNALALEEETLP